MTADAGDLVDNVQLSFQHEAGARCDVAMIHTPGAGIEFDDHIRRVRPDVHVEQFVVTTGSNEVFPIHVFGIEAEVVQGLLVLHGPH
jgi:hypothetical protein